MPRLTLLVLVILANAVRASAQQMGEPATLTFMGYSDGPRDGQMGVAATSPAASASVAAPPVPGAIPAPSQPPRPTDMVPTTPEFILPNPPPTE